MSQILEIFTPKAILQILILATGIYVLLAFLRSARGSGVVRGIGVTFIVGVYSLWWLTGRYELDELRLVIQGLLGIVFVILAIVFQPELRRGITSLSDNPLLSRFLSAQRKESVSEVTSAIVSMAKKKQGALIAFERRTPLESYANKAVQLDCEVNRELLDTIFHDGSALHDGGVILRGDRIVAAGAVFPLSESDDVARTTGTRHRAALGITEETDSVAIAVSEETGLISISKSGKMERRIKRDQVEEVLREALGTDGALRRSTEDGEEGEATLVPEPQSPLQAVLAHGGQKFAALMIAVFVFYGAHQDLMGSEEHRLRTVATYDAGTPQPGALTVVLPTQLHRLKTEPSVDVTFVGTHQDLLEVNQDITGFLRLTEDQLAAGTTVTIAPESIDWRLPSDRVNVYWSGAELELTIEKIATYELELEPGLIRFDDSEIVAPYAADRDAMEFRPSTLQVRGTQDAIGELQRLLAQADGPQEERVLFEATRPLTSTMIRTGAASLWIPCAPGERMADLGIAMDDQLQVKIPIELGEKQLGTIDLDVALISLGTEGTAQEPGQFLAPSAKAEVRVYGVGVPPWPPGSQEWEVEKLSILDLARDHVRAFIDINRIETGSRLGVVELHETSDWPSLLNELGPDYDYVLEDPRVTLRFEFISDREVLLDPREEDGEGGGQDQ